MVPDINALLAGAYDWFSAFAQGFLPTYISPNLEIITQLVILVIVGYLVGKMGKAIAKKILSVVGLQRITTRTMTEDVLRVTGYKGDVVEFIGDLVKWSIYIIVITIVIQVLGFSDVAVMFNQLILFVPRVIISILVVILGLMIADFFGKVFEEGSRRMTEEEMFARFSGGLVKYSISMVAIIMALGLIGIDTNAMLILFSALLGVVLIMFFLGLKDFIPNYTAGMSLKSSLRVGDRIKAGKYSGIVEKITPFSLLLRTKKNKTVIIPNGLLAGQPVEKELKEKRV